MYGESVTKNRLRQKTKRCVVCDRLFETSRQHAKTCSHNCRQRAYRKKLKVWDQYFQALNASHDLLKAVEDPIVQQDAFQRIIDLKAVVSGVVIKADQTSYGKQLSLFQLQEVNQHADAH